MWMATNSGKFSVAYNDGSFSAQGSFDSAGNFGEMGTERNGSFVRRDDRDEGENDQGRRVAADPPATRPLSANAALAANSPKFKGMIPIENLIH